MENQIIELTIWFVAIVWTISGMFRILFPYYNLKQYMTGKWKIPNDNLGRFGGIITLAWGGYVLLYVLGYIK